MEGLPLTALALCLFIPAGESQFTIHAEHSRINVTEGGNAFFSVRPTAEFAGGNWGFDGKTVVQWTDTKPFYGSGYQSRAELFTSNGSLLLKMVNTLDSGEYTVTMFTHSGSLASATVTLRITEAISKPTISANNTHPVEHNDAVALTCDATGSPTSFEWFHRNETIRSGDRTALTQGNKTLVISGVLRTDGEFVCRVSDAYNEKRSDPYNLNVAYGLESLIVSISPELALYPAGSNVTFSCSTVSNPAAQFQWNRNNSTHQKSGNQLIIADLSLNHTGNYTCKAFNSITQKSSVTTRFIVVIEPVSKPVITSNDTDPVEYNDTVSLTCHARGTDVSYLWFMNNTTVSAGGRITLSSNNSTLTISGVLRSDEEFTCVAYNLVNKNTSDPFLLSVRYGPENLTISISPDIAAYGTGSNVNFSCSALSNPAPAFQWYFNGSSLQTSGQRLNLVDLSLNDTGSYACEAFNNVTKGSSSTTRNLVVLEPVSEPNITANATILIEYNDTVKLTCFATGTAVSYLWLEDNRTIVPGRRFELGADNSTLTISEVLRTDGPFTCIAYNSISEKSSEPFELDVYYGPDRPNITTDPDSPPYLAGSTVTFTCSAGSRPVANLDWYLNGDFLQTGQQLILDNISMSKTGNYTCQAFNNFTEKYSASTPEITVLEPVSNVNVARNNLSPVEINDTVVLICDAQGTIQRRTWLKNNLPIQENDRIYTSSDKANLTITRVNRTDTATYNCTVSNDYNSGSAAIYMQVNYGPENVRILPQGPVEADIGSRLTLTCSAQSVPSGEYKWYNRTNHLQTGQQYTIEPGRSVDSGNYTCEVYNNVTMKRSSRTVEVLARIRNVHTPGGLSAAAIAGIVIGVVAGIAIVGAFAAWFIKKYASRMKVAEIHHGRGKPGVNNTLATDVADSAQTYENMPRNQKSSAHPTDENSTYMGLVLEDRSLYSDLRRN